MEDNTLYFSKAALWGEDWVEDTIAGCISHWGVTIVDDGDYVEKEWYYELLEEYTKLLSAYKELKHHMEGLEK